MSHIETRDDTDALLRLAGCGDAEAVSELLARHRARLRRTINSRMDSRLNARVDASDVVQEVLIRATQYLPDYLRERRVSFYPWLRAIALHHLVDLRRKHIDAQRRSVLRENSYQLPLCDDSAIDLCQRLVYSGSGPSARLSKSELRRDVLRAVGRLPDTDREVLAMRVMEQMSVDEVAETMGCSAAAVKSRQYRAIKRLRTYLAGGEEST